ncbi:RNA polymerase sigma factor [Xylanimonas protaetiae]|uniref:RNA polymerase sigma factor n=1 Tax=Xylanimonas protaetiae TaxID=2509457 RepID=A0A4P6F258_9MICO|nr:RNA polymerase sigma factor [Xylanimonas protaetiae]QAY68783.1 RNA polymerase sigma factor [Xylanimonas protaetiae]
MLRCRGAVCIRFGTRWIGAVLDHDVVLDRFRLGHGPRAEFEEFARSTYSDLHGYVLRQVGPNDVADVVSEAFTTAWRRWGDRPPTQDRWRAWVFGIAHKKILELYRTHARDRRVEASVAAQPHRACEPADGVVATDRVQRWLGELPAHERAPVYLVTISGFTFAEAGAILGHPTSTISTRVSRALQRLRPLVDAETEGIRRGLER